MPPTTPTAPTAGHSPLPWRTTPGFGPRTLVSGLGTPGSLRVVLSTFHPSDAALAKRAVNHHPALVAALRDLLEWADWIKAKCHRSPRMDEPNTGAIVKARATLAALDAEQGA